MPYKVENAKNTLFRYMNIREQDIKYIDSTDKRGFVLESQNSLQSSVVFIYPISHKADDSKNFFDTRDSGAYERGVAWNYALENKHKYFCFAVNDQVDRYKDYIFSLECNERTIEKVSGTINGVRAGRGTQVVIPNNFEPTRPFERIKTKNGFFISAIKKDELMSYMQKYDNRPYMSDEELIQLSSVAFRTGIKINKERNRIIFGAPGTGKSFTLRNEAHELLLAGGDSERVTFHPDYSYANFVGTYKPVPYRDTNGNSSITYEYVPGPFMRTYVSALRDTANPHLLIIEEINRANTAAVFGDVFQLLDRDDNNVSEYPVQASEDMKAYLAKELGGEPQDYSELCIPDNMFIWATMNSADQGVFPLDTAFKRRWDFTYLGIDAGESGMKGNVVTLGDGEYCCTVEWNDLRKAINEELLTYKVNEDKLLGPYFILSKYLPSNNDGKSEPFCRVFKNKVLMYLFDDAAKQKRKSLFGGCEGSSQGQYSKICGEFDRKGVHIFCESIRNKLTGSQSEEIDK